MLTQCEIQGIKLIIYRDDLNHPTVSGNKLHKLLPNIKLARDKEVSQILSFGGAFSNHLHALAWACKESGLQSIGVVRGELHVPLTPTLKDCEEWGMKLLPISRKAYREYQEQLRSFAAPCSISELNLNQISQDVIVDENTLVLPEGGSNKIAIQSLANAYDKVFTKTDCKNITHAVCATGTGATLAGLYKAAPNNINLIGMQAVAEQDATIDRINSWLGCDASRITIEESHLGRFAKTTAGLMEFIDNFEAQMNIVLEPVYTGKAMLKLIEMIEANYFKQGDEILFIHTGGLQGKRGFYKKAN